MADNVREPSCHLSRPSCWPITCVTLSCTLVRPPGSLIVRLPGRSIGEGPWLNPLFSPVHTCEARCQPYHKPPLRYPILIMRRSARGWPLVGIGSFTLYRLLIIALQQSRSLSGGLSPSYSVTRNCLLMYLRSTHAESTRVSLTAYPCR
jgi:hypothetical protein